MTDACVVNCNDLVFTDQGNGETFQARIAAIGSIVGAQKLGYRIVELPAGKCAWPCHAHYANEEMFFVLAGSGELRVGDEWRAIVQGDFIACPAGPDTPHQIKNTSEEPLQYLCVSTMIEPDVVVYPDSNKYAVIAGSAPGDDHNQACFTAVNYMDDRVGYWDGES